MVSRPIVDMTGLQGSYHWRLRYQMVVPNDPNVTEAPQILDALPEQLGLALERRTGPVDVFVIDHVERPNPD